MIFIWPLFISPLVVFIIYSMISWLVHIKMVKEECESFKKGSFKDFITNFVLYYMNGGFYYDKGWGSFFGPDELHDKNYIHASIIKFGGEGLILDYISYIRFCIWKFQQNLKRRKNKEE